VTLEINIKTKKRLRRAQIFSAKPTPFLSLVKVSKASFQIQELAIGRNEPKGEEDNEISLERDARHLVIEKKKRTKERPRKEIMR